MSFLVVTGTQTALRIAAPPVGALKLGSSAASEIRVLEPGIAPVHCELFFGAPPGVRALAAEVAVVSPMSTRERPVHAGVTVTLEAGERVRVGPVDVEWIAPEPFELEPRLFDLTTLDARLAEGVKGLLLCLEGDFTAAADARLGSGDFAIELDAGQIAVWLQDGEPHDAQTFVSGLPLALTGVTSVTGEPVSAAEVLAAASAGRTPQPYLHVASKAPAMVAVERLLRQAAESDAPTLVLGETGTGKDLAVELIHEGSRRAGHPLVRLSAIQVGDEGLDPELEHRALGGTLVLDEVSALGARAQLSLTRSLEAQTKFRVVATSNHDLDALVEAGRFRKDLFFRLAHIRVDLPPLRDRSEDIGPLAEAFAAAAGAETPLDRGVVDALTRHRWPGNVRELESVVRRAALASPEGRIEPAHLYLPLETRGTAPAEVVDASETVDAEGALSLREEIAALERRRILEALERHSTQTEAAKALGVPLRTFLNRMDALGIPRARKK